MQYTKIHFIFGNVYVLKYVKIEIFSEKIVIEKSSSTDLPKWIFGSGGSDQFFLKCIQNFSYR